MGKRFIGNCVVISGCELGFLSFEANGFQGRALKAPNGHRAHFDRPGIKTTIYKINNFSVVAIICPKYCCTQLS